VLYNKVITTCFLAGLEASGLYSYWQPSLRRNSSSSSTCLEVVTKNTINKTHKILPATAQGTNSYGKEVSCPTGSCLSIKIVDRIANDFVAPMYQPTATNTSVRGRSHALIFLIIAHVRIQMSKIRSNWVKEVLSASRKEATSLERRRGRSSWLGKVYCNYTT
jgi:hypothetical protein